MTKAVRVAWAILFCLVHRQATAGVLSAVNDAADNAVVACLRAHPIPDEKSHTGEAASADFDVHIHQCESEFRALLLECRVAGRSEHECTFAVLIFVNETINGR
jgi:hypothetical protein